MTIDFISLAVIALIALVVPIVSRLVPNRIIPEVVFLLFIGAIVGPNMLGFVQTGDTISFMSDLGLGFLFLLAGFEIDPKIIKSKLGAHSFISWVVSFIVAITLVLLLGLFKQDTTEAFAVAIALTSTALGTLMPILAERGLMGNKFGNIIIAYGTWGELGPVIAMAILLSTRSAWASLLVLAVLGVICVLLAIFGKRVANSNLIIRKLFLEGDSPNSQTFVRATIVLLTILMALASLFQVDLVLGSFAAGFVLRFLVPAENKELEHKLNAIAHGFFIPIFFVVSGANIDLFAIADKPMLLVMFLVTLLVVKFLPLFIDLHICKDAKGLSIKDKLSVSFYCTAALPIIVAVTSVAVGAGAMTSEVSSVLVAAGAITILIMPLLGLILHPKEK